MSDPPEPAVHRLLTEVGAGSSAAADELIPLVYDELRSLARGQRTRLGGSETLNTTALIHEAYLKLAARDGGTWKDQAHFLAVASRAMRQILIDYARRKHAAKRGAGRPHLSLDELPSVGRSLEFNRRRASMLIALDEALSRLGDENERQCRIVECRFFGGMTIEQTAVALGVSPASVKRGWSMAQAWLYRDLQQSLAD